MENSLSPYLNGSKSYSSPPPRSKSQPSSQKTLFSGGQKPSPHRSHRNLNFDHEDLKHDEDPNIYAQEVLSNLSQILNLSKSYLSPSKVTAPNSPSTDDEDVPVVKELKDLEGLIEDLDTSKVEMNFQTERISSLRSEKSTLEKELKSLSQLHNSETEKLHEQIAQQRSDFDKQLSMLHNTVREAKDREYQITQKWQRLMEENIALKRDNALDKKTKQLNSPSPESRKLGEMERKMSEMELRLSHEEGELTRARKFIENLQGFEERCRSLQRDLDVMANKFLSKQEECAAERARAETLNASIMALKEHKSKHSRQEFDSSNQLRDEPLENEALSQWIAKESEPWKTVAAENKRALYRLRERSFYYFLFFYDR
jgi:chromosome segregation ATPase